MAKKPQALSSAQRIIPPDQKQQEQPGSKTPGMSGCVPHAKPRKQQARMDCRNSAVLYTRHRTRSIHQHRQAGQQNQHTTALLPVWLPPRNVYAVGRAHTYRGNAPCATCLLLLFLVKLGYRRLRHPLHDPAARQAPPQQPIERPNPR